MTPHPHPHPCSHHHDVDQLLLRMGMLEPNAVRHAWEGHWGALPQRGSIHFPPRPPLPSLISISPDVPGKELIV